MADQQTVKLKIKKRGFYIGGGLLILAGVVGSVSYFFYNRAIESRAATIRDFSIEVSAGRLKALASEDGTLSGELLEAVGKPPRARQPERIQEALRELDDAILRHSKRLYDTFHFTPAYRNELTDLLIVSGTPVAPDSATWNMQHEPHFKARTAFLKDWLMKPQEAMDLRLEQVMEALRAASAMADHPFMKALHQSKIELWRTKIRHAGEELAPKIETILGLLGTSQEEPANQFRVTNRMFLATQVIWSMQDKGEAEIINAALIDLRPSLEGLQKSGFRFDVVLSTVEACDSGETCKAARDRLWGVLKDLDKLTETRKPLLETVLLEILENLSLDEKRKAWEMMLAKLDSLYLFSVDDAAWPQDLKALPARARQALNSPDKTLDVLDELLKRMVERPIYESEVRYLLRAVETRWARYRLIENCHAARLQLSKGVEPKIYKHFRIVSSDLQETQKESRFTWDAVPGSTTALSAEADQILRRLAPAQRRGFPYGWPARDFSELAEYLKIRLRPHCRALADTKPRVCNGYQ